MRKITAVTQFIQEVSVMIDMGGHYSIEEIEQHIEGMDVIDWLEKEFPFNKTGIDFSLFGAEERKFIHEALESILGGYRGQERRKWLIEKNGLCLLISWSTEIIRDLYGRVGQR